MGKIMDEMIKQFLADQSREGKRPQTIAAYATRLQVYGQWLSAQGRPFAAVDHDDIEAYKRALYEQGLSNASVKAYLTTVSAMYQWAQRRQLVKVSPVTRQDYPPQRPARIRRMTDEELRQFTSYIDTLQENIRAAFWCLLGTGARVSEVAKLRVTDVQLRGHAVYVAITDAKWGSDRTIPIVHPTAAEVVWRFTRTVEVDSKPLFRVSKRTLERYASNFAMATGITFRCHLLRHTFAAKLTEEGVPITTVQYLLGHKSVGMTAYYAQSALVDLDEITPKIETQSEIGDEET